MDLENQIEYEYNALIQLKDSKRTPVPIYVDGSKKYLNYGVLVMNFLEGVYLDYEKDLNIAASCLADIHSIKIEENTHLLCPKNPFEAIIDECKAMVQTYYKIIRIFWFIKNKNIFISFFTSDLYIF